MFSIGKNLVAFIALAKTSCQVACPPEIRGRCIGAFQDLLIFGQLILLPVEACEAFDPQSAAGKTLRVDADRGVDSTKSRSWALLLQKKLRGV